MARLGAAQRGRGTWEIETAPPADAAADALRAVPGALRVEAGPETAERTLVLQVEAAGDRSIATGLARALLEAGRPLYGLRRGGASLEDVFLALTTEETEANGTGDDAGTAGAPAADS